MTMSGYEIGDLLEFKIDDKTQFGIVVDKVEIDKSFETLLEWKRTGRAFGGKIIYSESIPMGGYLVMCEQKLQPLIVQPPPSKKRKIPFIKSGKTWIP